MRLPRPLPVLLLLAVLVATGCGGDRHAGPPGPPPSDQVEVITVAPAGDYVWINGHWAWHGGPGYVWVPGHWVSRYRPGAEWVPGHWSPGYRGGYRWHEGHWR